MSDYGLSPQQLAVICALSTGATMTAAAEQAGVHRNTINNWRRNLLYFQHALADAQYDRACHFREKTEDLLDLAIETIRNILNDPKAPPSVRLKAALAIVATATTPPPPKKQIELDIEKIAVESTPPVHPPVHNDAQPAQPAPSPVSDSPVSQLPAVATRPIVHNHAQPTPVAGPQSVDVPSAAASQPTVHNDAQSATPIERTNPKIGRNEACPCGSGKKFKRCCIDNPGAMAEAA
jgi:transposase-like protein